MRHPATWAKRSLLLGLLLWTGPAGARDLGEILADKGVITPEEQQEATTTRPGPTIAYKQGRGFVFSTADERWRLELGGYAQVRYTLLDVDDALQNPSKGVEDSQSIDIPRARIWWRGHALTPRLKYEFEIDLAASSGDLARNLYMDYQLVEGAWLHLRGGQWKTPLCRQEMTPDWAQEFNERSLACQSFRFERARGVELYGLPMDSLLEYYLGAFDTTGRNGPSNPDANFLYVARLATNPLGAVGYLESDVEDSQSPRFGLGASYAYERARADELTSAATAGPDPGDPAETILTAKGQPQGRVPFQRSIQPAYASLANPTLLTADIQVLGIDLAARYRGLFVEAEYFHSFVGNSAHAGAAPAPPFALPPGYFEGWGYYGQAGYFVIPRKLELAIRYSEIQMNDRLAVSGAGGAMATPWQSEVEGAVNWYFAAHNLELMSDFAGLRTAGVQDTAGRLGTRDDFRMRVQAQLVF